MIEFGIVILVCQKEMGVDLLNKLEHNSVRPGHIIVFDNSNSGGFDYKMKTNVPLDILRYEKPLGLNDSWNKGKHLLPECKYVSVLNEDIIVSCHFLYRIKMVFLLRSNAGIVIPNTGAVSKVEDTSVNISQQDDWQVVRKRKEGWAFTIRQDIYNKMLDIPTSNMATFCGDNWIFQHVEESGYDVVKDMGNYIFHYGGATIGERGLNKGLTKEKAIYNNLKR